MQLPQSTMILYTSFWTTWAKFLPLNPWLVSFSNFPVWPGRLRVAYLLIPSCFCPPNISQQSGCTSGPLHSALPSCGFSEACFLCCAPTFQNSSPPPPNKEQGPLSWGFRKLWKTGFDPRPGLMFIISLITFCFFSTLNCFCLVWVIQYF